jgi:hypothetical protein
MTDMPNEVSFGGMRLTAVYYCIAFVYWWFGPQADCLIDALSMIS